MSYYAPYLDEGGIHVPSYEERLEGLIAGYKQIFGEDVYIDPDTMDYQLLSLVAKCWDDLNSVILDSYYARNPNFASGSALDMILPLNGMIRNPATKSSVTLTLKGVPEETMEAGMQAMDDDENIWEIPTEVTFDENGDATATAYCTVAGPVQAGVGTITIINTPNGKWESVTNLTAAKLGNAVETDAQVRLRRAQNLARQSQNTVEAVTTAVLNVPNVKTVKVLENTTSSQVEVDDSVYIAPHSIMVVVYGGNANAIAEAIWRKKGPGCGTSGNLPVNYVDEYNQTHVINLRRGVTSQIKITITLRIFATFDEKLLNELIPYAVAGYINELGIGDDLILSLLNSVIYGANTTGKTVFSVIGISGDVPGKGIYNETDTIHVSDLWLLRCDETQVTVTKLSSDTYKIEVG